MSFSERASDRIGERIAFYRRLNGWSAAELSEVTGKTISKGVIANIETGRKKDVTVDELLTLSFALGVPPLAIALPLDRPESMVTLVGGKNELHASQVSRVARSFVEPAMPWRYSDGIPKPTVTPAGALANARADSLFKWHRAIDEIAGFRKRLREAKASDDQDAIEKYTALVDESQNEVLRLEDQMRSYGMQLRDNG
ncbi:helix-turn-helix domain-containing protein [Leucobacter sp. Z1108]|uniref:helix-turn-helix domain-containing protein n=1 Tax=Leucobacter sp. Z1108 TaxID=3439066 RepID=UPI003F3C7A23